MLFLPINCIYKTVILSFSSTEDDILLTISYTIAVTFISLSNPFVNVACNHTLRIGNAYEVIQYRKG